MAKPQFIAVIDIGKTNKKVVIFDENLKTVDSAYKSFNEYIENNIHFEDVAHISAWLIEQLSTFAKRYTINAISVTTHGATAMCIDKNGDLAVPSVAYTTDAGQEFSDGFFARFGSREELQKTTATAEIGNMINIAKLVYFLQKTYTQQFKQVTNILNYPQYFGYLLTKKTGAECTYTGCHTYLFDFLKKTYSSVATSMDIRKLLPPKISKSWEILGTITPDIAKKTGLPTDCIVTMGIHDSNSSLLPYLVKGHKNFVLNSTGTWCVAMHPAPSICFEKDELGKMVFFNLDAFFNPVKTVIFMGGLELETYTTLLKKINGTDAFPVFDPAIYQTLIAEKQKFIIPSVVKGAGIFPLAHPAVVDGDHVFPLSALETGTIPPLFTRYDEAFAVVVLSLAVQTRIALDMVGFADGGTIFVEGGFRKNKAYNALLAALYPRSNVCLTNLQEATAFGAAILAKAALDKSDPLSTDSLFSIDTTTVERPKLHSMEAYCEAFKRRVEA